MTQIVKSDPKSDPKSDSKADLNDNVLNGITYIPNSNNEFYITGKN